VQESSDEGDDSDDSASSDSSDDDDEKDAASDSDDSDDSESETEAPSKKRKAEDEPASAGKKAKTEVAEDTGSKNLFVGNLSWNIDDEWLFREFEEFGEITRANVLTDRESGRSKGFGYVEFTTSAAATAALKAKKGALIDGREANVDYSTPRDNAAPKDRAQNRAKTFGDSQNPPSDTLFCGNLSFDADENMIGEAFGEHGTVVNVRLPTDM
jgi:nucleolin